MLKIRLMRLGRKKKPCYRIVVANSLAPRDGSHKCVLGTYAPLLPKDDPSRFKIDLEKFKYWVSVGALQTDTIKRLMKTVQMS